MKSYSHLVLRRFLGQTVQVYGLIAIIGATFVLGGCMEETLPSPSANIAGVAYPPSGLATVHSLDLYAEGGTVHVLLAGPGDDSRVALRYTRSNDGGTTWSPPIAVEPLRLETTPAIGDLDGADLARPGVDVLEQVALNCLQVGKLEVARRHGLNKSLGDELAFPPSPTPGRPGCPACYGERCSQADSVISTSAPRGS